MNYRYARRVEGAAPTLIRQVMEYAKDKPDFCSLYIGNPAYETCPVEEMRAISDEVFAKYPREMLSYGYNQGTTELREAIRKRMIHRGVDMTDQEVLIIPGSGHGIDLMVNTFCNPGQKILVEKVTYSGIVNGARMGEGQLVGVAMDEQGMDPDDLDALATKNPDATFLYAVTTFSNPTGVTWPLARRKAIYEVAQKHNLMIYEDDPYGELRFAGEAVPTMKHIDTDGRVVYAGSFSKILSAGLRVGYTVVHKDIYPLFSCSQGNWGLNSNLAQMIVSTFMERYDMDKHIQGICDFYGKKAAVMFDAIDRHFPKECVRTHPEGGLFVWVTIPDHIEEIAAWHELMEAGVGVVPSKNFAADPSVPGHAFRLNYSLPTPEEMERGCKIMGDYLKKRIHG